MWERALPAYTECSSVLPKPNVETKGVAAGPSGTPVPTDANGLRSLFGAGDRTRLAFFFPSAGKKNIGRTQCAHWVQQPATGRLHINGFESFTIPTNVGGLWAALAVLLRRS